MIRIHLFQFHKVTDMIEYRFPRAKLLTAIALLGAVLFSSCAGRGSADARTADATAPAATPATEASAAKPTVAVSILPQAWFVRRIAAGRIEPLTLVGKGQSPHSWEASPRRLEELSRAAAWITVGIEFEHALEPKVRSLYPAMTIADGSRGVAFRKLEAHSHGEEQATEEKHAEETADGRDPHFWLGREGAERLAENVRDTLVMVDPGGAETFRSNCATLIKEIDTLFDSLIADLAPLRGTTAFVFHPAFGYFLDEFGIEQEAVETGGKEPTPQALSALIREAKADGARVIFVQAQFPTAAARTVAQAIGGEVAEIDDLAEDWDANLRRMGDALRKTAR